MPITPLLADLIGRQQPYIVLWGATDQGRDLALRVAARLGTRLASNCTRVRLNDDDLLLTTRPVYGGMASCDVVCRWGRPRMATLQAGGTPARCPEVCRHERGAMSTQMGVMVHKITSVMIPFHPRREKRRAGQSRVRR
jgi:electron transfer flavoprotein alpha subunit